MSLMATLKFVLNHPLNKDRKTQALLGYLKWQVGSRLVPGAIVFEWVAGTRVFVKPGETGFTQNVYCGLQDFEDMSYVLHVVASDDLFVDVGANVGSYTVLACAAKGARGYCFEPIPSTYQRLADNILINNLSSRVTAMNLGLSDKDGELVFTSGENCTNHVLTGDGDRSTAIIVHVRTLDSVLAGESPAVMKIDVEGFETSVLTGAAATLSNPSLHSVLMELNGSGARYGFDEEGIVRTMNGYGFKTYEYDPFARELRQLQGRNPRSNNTLFLRNEDTIREKINCAPRMRIGSCEI